MKVGIGPKRCQNAFENLKKATTKQLVMTLPDVIKALEVQMGAFNFAKGCVLVQDRQLVASECRKLNEAEHRCTMQKGHDRCSSLL